MLAKLSAGPASAKAKARLAGRLLRRPPQRAQSARPAGELFAVSAEDPNPQPFAGQTTIPARPALVPIEKQDSACRGEMIHGQILKMRRIIHGTALALLLSVPAQAQTNPNLSQLQRRLDVLNKTNNAYVRLGQAVAQRFVNFAAAGGANASVSLAWQAMHFDGLAEVAQVLDETEKIEENKTPLFDWMPLKLRRVKLKGGTFYNGRHPCYFGGYGHFNSVIEDLPNFPALGMSLIQDGRAGPSAMNADGTLGPGALAVLQGLDRAGQFGMRDDFLLSPHYYPSWGGAPDLASGSIGFSFNIFHPTSRKVLQQWAAAMAERMKNKPALNSVCLANEPAYNASGRDKYSRPLFIEFLKQKHHTLQELNSLYGTHYTDFGQVVVPDCAMPGQAGPQRAYYDWTCFNNKMFADWHAWLGSILKTHGLTAPTHSKICVFQTLDRDKVGWGVDPELICQATDLAGCDAYAPYSWHSGKYVYDFTGQELYYDLLHSFRGQPVFNSENHLSTDGSGPAHVPMNHTRSVLWQGGLHHQGMTTIWVWEMSTDPSLAGNIYFRPANIFGAGRAMLDLNRLGPEVAAINDARPRVALLYSPPSIFWEEKYKSTVFSLYTMLDFLGEPVTFVSERQLAAGAAPHVKYLIVPNASRIFDTTPAALNAFQRAGGSILRVGQDSLTRDEYDRPLNLPLPGSVIESGTEEMTLHQLRVALNPLELADLREKPGGQAAWGIEFRVVPFARATLIPLINFNQDARLLAFPKWAGRKALDLLSGESVDLSSISLEPMLPRLLRINQK